MVYNKDGNIDIKRDSKNGVEGKVK